MRRVTQVGLLPQIQAVAQDARMMPSGAILPRDAKKVARGKGATENRTALRRRATRNGLYPSRGQYSSAQKQDCGKGAPARVPYHRNHRERGHGCGKNSESSSRIKMCKGDFSGAFALIEQEHGDQKSEDSEENTNPERGKCVKGEDHSEIRLFPSHSSGSPSGRGSLAVRQETRSVRRNGSGWIAVYGSAIAAVPAM
jgi:hypothetical protein